MAINFLLYLNKNTSSTLLALSAILVLLLAASPLLVFDLQPVQAQTQEPPKKPAIMYFQTLAPAISQNGSYALIFEAEGTLSSDNQSADITRGDVKTFYTADGPVCSGIIAGGQFTKNNNALVMNGAVGGEDHCGSLRIKLETSCSNSIRNVIIMTTDDVNVGLGGTFYGPANCSIEEEGGGNSTSTSMSGTAQDSDGDGIPDSSDNCTHNSNHRCFKEGDTSKTNTTNSTTTHEKQQPSSSSSSSTSSSSSGNQTS